MDISKDKENVCSIRSIKVKPINERFMMKKSLSCEEYSR